MSATNIFFEDPNKIRTFTSNSTFTVPQGVRRVHIWAIGGGGGGGGTRDILGVKGGAGGGSSYPNARWVEVSPTDVLSITVGIAGAGGGVYANGNIGGDSVVTGSFGSVRSIGAELGQRGDVDNGGGQFFGARTPTQGNGGNGGRGYFTDTFTDGVNGSSGQASDGYLGGQGGLGGDGGSSASPGGCGGGGGGASSVSGQGGNGGNGDNNAASGGGPGLNATGYGAGGGGAGGGGYAGGNGSPGLVIISW